MTTCTPNLFTRIEAFGGPDEVGEAVVRSITGSGQLDKIKFERISLEMSNTTNWSSELRVPRLGGTMFPSAALVVVGFLL